MSYLIGGIKLQISSVEPVIHSPAMLCLFLLDHQQFFLRDDRVVVNNAG